MEKQGMRISFSSGTKIGEAKFGSFDVHVSMSDDVKDGETPEECYKRLRKFVLNSVHDEVERRKARTLAEREERKRRAMEDQDDDTEDQIKRKAASRGRNSEED